MEMTKQKMHFEPIERTTLDVDEIAVYLNLSKDFIYKLCREKKIPCVRVGRRILFKRKAIDDWLEKKMQDSVEDEY